MVLGSLGSRSRSGCITCRRKHRKCDEQRPVCKLCQSGGLECVYRTTVKWADSHNINTFNASLQQKGKSSRRAANSATRRSLLSTPPQTQEPQSGSSIISHQHAHPGEGLSSPRSLPQRPTRTRDVSTSYSSIVSVSEGLMVSTPPAPQSNLFNGSHDIGGRIDGAPRIELPFLEGIHGVDNNHTLQLERYNYDADQTLHGPGHWEDSDEDGSNDDLEDYNLQDGEDLTTTEHDTWVVDNTISNLLFQTSLASGEEIAFMYYFKRVCTCIPAFDSSSNPYRKLALISLSHPVLLHGILSVSTAHMHNYGRSNDAILSARQSRALKSLQAALGALLIHKDQAASPAVEMRPFADTTGIFSILSARELALAAIMMQTSSVLMTGIGSVEVHIKCALEFIRDLDCLYRPANSIFGRLLVHRFAMVDVVLAHFRFRRPLAPIDFFMYQDNEQMDHEEPSFREMQGSEQRVLCFLAQVACLSAELADFPNLDGEIQAKGYELETEMRIWGRKYHSAMAQSTRFDSLTMVSVVSTLGSEVDQQTALDIVCECFYWTAQILLLRRVFLDPTRSTRVQLIRKHVFRLMDRLHAGCGPDSSLPFPFYMAAREAVTPEDRDWVRQKHAAMMDSYRDRSREYLMAATEKMWEKEASAEAQISGGTRLLDTEYERFIRETDKQASYFMF